MIQVRHEQVKALRAAAVSRFAARMKAHLEAKFPDRVGHLPDDELIRNVRRGIARAESHGVLLKPDIRTYLECLVTYGDAFPQTAETAWAVGILADEELTGTEKMDRVRSYEVFVSGRA